MNITLYDAIETIILVVALSTDAFVASFAYGTDKVKIPVLSVVTIAFICSATLIASLMLGSVISPLLPEKFTKIVCFVILFILGFIKLFDSSIKTFIRKHRGIKRELRFSFLSLNFILNVYADPHKANEDSSKDLSPSEAASLALALSLDGIAVGFGAGLLSINILFLLLCSLVSNAFAVIWGFYIGNKMSEKLPWDLSWLSGFLLIILSFLKL